MKRTILDITKNLYRSNVRVQLTPIDLNDSQYYIYSANSVTLQSVLTEMQNIEPSKLIKITINNQYISNDDYLIEPANNYLVIKLLKSKVLYEYPLSEKDSVVLNTQRI